jgi:hypothetical protein
MKLITKSTFALLVCLAALQSCKKAEEGYAGDYPDKAKVLFINAALNGSTNPAVATRPIGIYEYYNGVTYNLYPLRAPFGNGYKVVEPGTLNLRLDTAFSPTTNTITVNGVTKPFVGPAATQKQFQLPVQAGSYYTFFATGLSTDIQPFFVKDEVTLPTDRNKTRIVFYNLSPDAGPIDIWDERKQQIIASNVTFKTERPYVDLDFAPNNISIQLRVYQAGTTTPLTGAKTGMVLNPNSVYTVYITGFKTRPAGVGVVNEALAIHYYASWFTYNTKP